MDLSFTFSHKMPRLKEITKIFHTATTHEIFVCLSDMIAYSRLLLEYGPPKPYQDFLKWIIEMNFYETEERINIKKISADFKTNGNKIAKWLVQICNDIFELNNSKPALFQKEGIKIALRFRQYDNCCIFYLSLPVIPREFESFHFYFAKGKIGASKFWVKDVAYFLEDNNLEIMVSLEAAQLNKYREFILDSAIFHDKISFGDVLRKNSYELDDELKEIHRT